MKKPIRIWFDSPAEDNDYSWERMSFPMGNGHMGVNLFGGIETERMQITENSLANKPTKWLGHHWCSGMMNFAELYFDFPHKTELVTGYKRTLSLDTAIATVEYDYNGVHFTRETFGSYPDNVWAVRLTASQKGALSFTMRPVSPHNCDYLVEIGDNLGKHGVCKTFGDTVIQSGEADCFHVKFEGIYKVKNFGGALKEGDGTVTVENADSAEIYISVGTSYKLCEEVFASDSRDRLKDFPHPHEKVLSSVEEAYAKGYDLVKETHLKDYTGYFNRVEVDFGGSVPTESMDVFKRNYSDGKDKNAYLDELVYHMGRYVMLCTSREGCLPPNLQGIWNCFNIPPWTSGYWYNINIQMNYWSVFSENLPEMFKPYEEFNRVRLKALQNVATNYIKANFPEKHTEGQGMDGWTVGTANNPYYVSGPGGHSGPGQSGLTSKAYWDYYDFTRDKEILKKYVYPMLEGAARFYSKFVEKMPDGKYLCTMSASPEQHHNGKPYQTVGCGFDQQMMYENNRDFLEAAEILGDDEIVDKELVKSVKEQIEHYDPVQIGYSGQIKEFREEKYYGEIGEKGHRHISHLTGTAPGTLVNYKTPAWLDGAARALEGRGETFVGWGNIHRAYVWARCGNEKMCEHIFDKFISNNVYPNLLAGHNPNECFQVEAVLAVTGAMNETILQSHEGCLHALPALPEKWRNGSVKGILARGNYEVDLSWRNHSLTEMTVHARENGVCKVLYPTVTEDTVKVKDELGNKVDFEKLLDGMIAFNAEKGKSYTISGMPEFELTDAPKDLVCIAEGNDSVRLTWTPSDDKNAVYTVLRAYESSPVYETVASGLNSCEYTDKGRNGRQTTYKIVAECSDKKQSKGITKTVIPFGEEEKEEIGFGKGAGTFRPNCW